MYRLLYREQSADQQNGDDNTMKTFPSFSKNSTSKTSAASNRNNLATPQSRGGSATSYVYVGRARSHTAPITGLAFGLKDGMETLISISEDQYDFAFFDFCVTNFLSFTLYFTLFLKVLR
jgi:hypothetical protein